VGWKTVCAVPPKRQLLHDRSAQVRVELADLGVSVADYELLLIVSLEPRGVVL
jgi:hypothetical protein